MDHGNGLFIAAMAFVMDALAADAVVHMVRHLAHWFATTRAAARVPIPVYVYEDPDLPEPLPPENVNCSGCNLEARF